MDFITSLVSAGALSNAIGDLIYKYLYGWVQTWSSDWTTIGAFSVTTIMFTIFLKVLVSPLDIWQKAVMRKNNKKMEEMRPELEKITKQCGSNRELLAQKQRELYKKHKYSMFGSCLPMLLTMVIFFIVFGGFNSAVATHSKETYNALSQTFHTVYEETVQTREAETGWTDGNVELTKQIDAEATQKAGEAVIALYDAEYKESFFWVDNIFVADNWNSPVMKAADAQKNIPNLSPSDYNLVMKALSDKYNTGWNGYLILPLIVLLLNVASIFINKPMMQQQQVAPGQTEEQAKAQQSQSKMMQYIMPIMMFVFALFYSAAFTLYMAVNMIFTIILNLAYTLITKKKDDAERERMLSTTVKK